MQILTITPDEAVSLRLCMLWGAHILLSADVHSYEEMVERATAGAVNEEFAMAHDVILIVAGVPFCEAGTTNNLRVARI